MNPYRSSLVTAIGLVSLALCAEWGCAEAGAVKGAGSDGASRGGSAGRGGGASAGRSGRIIDAFAGSAAGGQSAASGVDCAPELKACGSKCVNTRNDPLNCGKCGNACPAALRECVDGLCVCPADTHQVCDEICADLRSDLSNCGVCGKIC